jgi:hypothetical protein
MLLQRSFFSYALVAFVRFLFPMLFPRSSTSYFFPYEALINEDFCHMARRERFLSAGILKIFRALKNVSNDARGQKDH